MNTKHVATSAEQMANKVSGVMQDAIAQVTDKAVASSQRIKQTSQKTAVKVGAYAKAHPVTTAGVVVAAGWLLTKLIKRKP